MARYKKLKELTGNFGFAVHSYNGARSLRIMSDRRPIVTIKNKKTYEITEGLVLRYMQIKKASISAGLLATTE